MECSPNIMAASYMSHISPQYYLRVVWYVVQQPFGQPDVSILQVMKVHDYGSPLSLFFGL